MDNIDYKEQDQILQELTNKFIEEFIETSSHTMDGGRFAIHYLLPKCLVNIPQEKFTHEYGVILPMSGMDTNLMKASINKRLVGFPEVLKEAIEIAKGDKEQDRFYMELLREESYEYTTIDLDWYGDEIGDFDVRKINCEGKLKTFSCWMDTNTFKGEMKVYYKEDKEKGEEYIDEVVFVVNNEMAFKIRNCKNGEDIEGELVNPKYIRSVNSFFNVVNCL